MVPLEKVRNTLLERRELLVTSINLASSNTNLSELLEQVDAALGRVSQLRCLRCRLDCFYEKVIKVKADVAALLIFDLRHISTEKFALGSLRSDDWQLGRPTVSPLLSVFP
jgi:hypothetical protein